MQYVVYFLVATPLLVGWLFWESAHMPPPPPLFVSGLDHLSTQPVRQAEAAPVPKTTKRQVAKNEASASE
jgi:hypothetical protein